jgi:Flp pilus assembly secretin CpaC
VIQHRIRTLLAGAALAAILGGIAVPAAADSIQIISVQTGHSLILTTDGLKRVAIGDGRIAGVVPIGTTQLVLNGKTSGHTSVIVWGAHSRTTYEVTVTDQTVDDGARLLRAAIDMPTVQVIVVNNNVILRGTVPDQGAYARVETILQKFNKFKVAGQAGGDVPIINALSVAKPLGNLDQEMAQVAGAHGLRADVDDKGNVIVSGHVHDKAGAERVLDQIKGLAGANLSAEGKIVDRLTIDTTSQVDVKVYVLEVDRTAMSQLGLRLQSAQLSTIGSTGQQSYTISSQQSFTAVENPAQVGQPGHPFNTGAFFRISLLAPTLDLMLSEGHAKILSSPDVLTLPGEEADFLVGGEIPIPLSNGLGTVSVSYKEYGVKLVVTPQVLSNGSVQTKIAPEVSDLDFADGVNLNGFVIPALKTSKLSTDVITKDGESVLMGGLLRRQEQKTVLKVPVLGDIPVLGQLFRSTSYQKNDSDVVFVMTPTVVTK